MAAPHVGCGIHGGERKGMTGTTAAQRPLTPAEAEATRLQERRLARAADERAQTIARIKDEINATFSARVRFLNLKAEGCVGFVDLVVEAVNGDDRVVAIQPHSWGQLGSDVQLGRFSVLEVLLTLISNN